MRGAGILTIIGAVLPVALGATLGMATTDAGRGTLAYPMPADAFLWLSIGLAVTHLLILAGYVAVARLTRGWARTFTVIAAVGTAVDAAVEVWAGLLADADRDSTVVGVLLGAYLVCGILIAVGTVGAGVALWRAQRGLALPLLVNGLILGLVALPARFLGSDELGIALLTVWGLTYIWLGVVLLRTKEDTLMSGSSRSAAAVAG